MGGRSLVLRRRVSEAGRAGTARPQVPGGVRRPGRRLPARGGALRGDGADRLRRHRGRHRRAHQHRDATDLEVRHRRAEAALPRAGDSRRADRCARHHRAGRRLGRRGDQHARGARRRRLAAERREDLHHQRRARALHRDSGQDEADGRVEPPPRHLVPDRRPRRGRQLIGSAQARLARLGHRHDQLPGRVRARGEPARRAGRGLQADHGQLPVGAPGDGARRGWRDDARVGAHRRVRRASARRSGARSPATRRSATSSPTSRPPCTRAAASPTTRCAASSPARSRCGR